MEASKQLAIIQSYNEGLLKSFKTHRIKLIESLCILVRRRRTEVYVPKSGDTSFVLEVAGSASLQIM